MNAASQHRLTPALVACAVLLAGGWLATLAGVGKGVRWDAPRAPAPLPSAHALAPTAPAHPLADFASVWQHSLFSPSRTPEAHAANGGSSLGDLQLTGVILTPHFHMALLHDKNSGRELRLHQGERTPDGSLTVVDVSARAVIIDSAQGRTELKLPAGAPIDVAHAASSAGAAGAAAIGTPGAASVQHVARMSQDAPPRQAPPDYNPEQLERLRKLKAAVQQRRAAEAAAQHEGAH